MKLFPEPTNLTCQVMMEKSVRVWYNWSDGSEKAWPGVRKNNQGKIGLEGLRECQDM